MRLTMICLAALLLPAATEPSGELGKNGGATLAIDIGDVRNSSGNVHVDICPENRFLKDNCPFSGNAHASAGTTHVTVTGLPPGRYAAQVYHDENGNGAVDQGLFGIPEEGIGFSNDARIHLGPPKFADAAFDFEQSRHIALKMRYFVGSKVSKGPR